VSFLIFSHLEGQKSNKGVAGHGFPCVAGHNIELIKYLAFKNEKKKLTDSTAR